MTGSPRPRLSFFRFLCLAAALALLVGCAKAQPVATAQPSVQPAGEPAPGVVAYLAGAPVSAAEWQQARAYAQAMLLLLGQPGSEMDEKAVFESYLEDRLLEGAADAAGFSLEAGAAAAEQQRVMQIAGADASRLAGVLAQTGLSEAGWQAELARSLRAATYLEDVVLAGSSSQQRDEQRRQYLLGLRQDANLVVMVTPPPSEGLEPGQIAPDFELAGLDGKPLRLSELRGRPVIVNFWATWCAPCRQEMPLLQETAERYGDQGLVVLGVDVGEDAAAVGNFARSLGVEFPILLDTTQHVSDRYRVYGLPTSFFIDREGVVDFRFIGPLDANRIERQLDSLGVHTDTPSD